MLSESHRQVDTGREKVPQPAREDRVGFRYRPGLDGLRAVAVLAVMGYHAQLGWLRGGFLGVDVFFVLSGFLITSLLLRELERSDRIDLLAFWGRRARRLLPALALVLIAVVIYARWFADTPALPEIRYDGIATLFFVNNWRYAWGLGSYFVKFDVFPSPLRHTWSLAIEEQFYVVWPVVLVCVWRLGRRVANRTALLFRMTAVAAMASALWMATLFYLTGDRTRVYFGADTRAQGVLIGSAVALYASHHSSAAAFGRWVRPLAIPAALVVAMFLIFVSDAAGWMYYGGFTLVSFAAAVLVVNAADSDCATSRVLSPRPLVAIGMISYGLYLWHWPVYVALGRTSLSGVPLLAARIGVTFACAATSYALVERPARSWRHVRRSTTLQRVSLGGVAALVLALALLASTSGATAVASFSSTTHNTEGVRVVLDGDSSMYTLYYYSHIAKSGRFDVRFWAPFGCGLLRAERLEGDPPPDGLCAQGPTQWRAMIANFDPAIFVVEFGVWDLAEHTINGAQVAPGEPAFNQTFGRALDVVRDIATRRGAQLVFLDAPCLPLKDSGSNSAFNTMLANYARAHADNVTILPWSEFLCHGGRPATVNGKPLRPDGIHFDGTSGPIVAAWLGPRLHTLAQQVLTTRQRH